MCVYSTTYDLFTVPLLLSRSPLRPALHARRPLLTLQPLNFSRNGCVQQVSYYFLQPHTAIVAFRFLTLEIPGLASISGPAALLGP